MKDKALCKVSPESFSRVIFRADSAGGRAYDIAHIIVILTSVAVTMATSVAALNAVHGTLLHTVEWFLTGLLTLDCIIRSKLSKDSGRNLPRIPVQIYQ